MSLYTGKKIYIFNWDELPIPDDVTQYIEHMDNDEGQLLIIDKQPMFKW